MIYASHENMVESGPYFPKACFKGSWDLHKALHKLAKSSNASQSSKPTKQFNPWPGYMFTGKLRPAMQVRESVNTENKKNDMVYVSRGHPFMTSAKLSTSRSVPCIVLGFGSCRHRQPQRAGSSSLP